MNRRSILVVEDERIVSLDIQNTLKRVGYDVAGTASSGTEALEKTGQLRPDLVLMDILLEGGMDGVEAAAAIAEAHDVPVVFLSAASDRETLDRAKVSGSYGYILKPFEERELHFAIDMALYKHSMEKDLRRHMLAAEAASEAKTAFLATVSHELRTPMNGILGMAELLLQTDMSPEQREYLELVKDSGLSLMNVLNDILDYSKIEAKTMELREGKFLLRDVVRDVVVAFRNQVRKRGIDFECRIMPGVPELLRGDSGRLRQVIANLVHNALNNTEGGGVVLEVDTAENVDGEPQADRPIKLLFSVSDSGRGIPSEKLGDIFESFKQIEDYMTRRQGGLGLGLAISRKLAHMLGGEIWAQSSLDQGSTFQFTAVFTVLAKPSDTLLPKSRKEDEELIRGLRILVAEDDYTSQRYAIRLLARFGCEVRGVENGLSALEELKANHYDAVLMDLQMPILNGLDSTIAIRDPETGCKDPDVPVIALTAHANRVDDAKCFAVGMNGFLSKPSTPDTLLAAIASAVRSRRGGREEANSPLLDMQGALKRMGGDLDLLADIYKAFLSDVPRRVRIVLDCVEQGDLEGAAKAAHTLKGAAMNAGADRLRDTAARVYSLAKEERADKIDTAVSEVRAVMDQTVAEVEENLDKVLAGAVESDS